MQDATAAPEHLDLVIIGAGLSGVGAACRVVTQSPATRFAILEARASIGGTWDLFRYPGVRSDSDMFTLGYGFRPWSGVKSLAPAQDILAYVRESAREYGIERHVRFGHRLLHASWSSADARWTLEIDHAGQRTRLTTNMLLMCSGYYSYESGHAPEFPGQENFRGQRVHPQLWPEDLDYTAKRVVVIGSGATAVTLVPAMAARAAHVTMLQRSPSYIVSRPSADPFAARMRRLLPQALANRVTRAKNILETSFLYRLARRRPAAIKRHILGLITKELGAAYDVETHFSPRYNPWDQRLCLVPDSDLFQAIKSGKASVETDEIAHFTETGIHLASGRDIPADIIVSATGLKLQLMGGAGLTVDGTPVDFANTLSYKGMMLSGVPNLLFVVGYTNASWTLKSDLVARYACRLLNFMRKRGYAMVVPERPPGVQEAPLIDFSSGYVERARGQLPKQGDRAPWRLYQSYLRDMPMLRFAPLADGTLKFTRKTPETVQ
jgi:cation diffusion facilitator CzcD-associated flavoprotein CzcO